MRVLFYRANTAFGPTRIRTLCNARKYFFLFAHGNENDPMLHAKTKRKNQRKRDVSYLRKGKPESMPVEDEGALPQIKH